ncbi:hypothetical protein PISMIDRAFT_350785 [Pisolithus microcarpus 441]|uniref:Uncharacterized protein n=1 Tax=Pisolithus microcarpus 441 TaxID=765257 RepID=A0A0C9Z387_9AGAM|nr:hypothetical protein PISMIDRAFT_350785 [Pisolithus microcarpus 441]
MCRGAHHRAGAPSPQHRHGERGIGIQVSQACIKFYETNATQPRTFKVFQFLRVPDVHERATHLLPIQKHGRESLEPRKT